MKIIYALSLTLQGVGNYSDDIDQQQEDSLEQERFLLYREECQTEWDEKLNTIDNFVQSFPGITPEEAQNVARNAGVIDVSGEWVDDDVWVKDCLDQKIDIFE
jgi:hypothetical protein